jgi:hypothetical protein
LPFESLNGDPEEISSLSSALTILEKIIAVNIVSNNVIRIGMI